MALNLKGLQPVKPVEDEAADIVAAVRRTDRTSPPTQIEPVSPNDPATKFNFRLRASSLHALDIEAEKRGITVKLLLMQGAKAIGVKLAPADLVDGSNRARRKYG